jgi:protein tyrosine/serine phosphatase
MRKILLTGLALLLCFSTGQKSLASTSLKGKDLPNFAQVAPGLLRGGQPTQRGLEQLKLMGAKTIISLRHNRTQVISEQQKAESLGLTFKRQPMDGLHKPSQTTISEFLSVVQDPANQPVFVHCEYGLDRTGSLIGIYRQEVQKWSAKDAYDEMVRLGFEKKYVWLADAVFDYEEDKLGTLSDERPMNVKVLDSIQSAIGTRPNRKVRRRLLKHTGTT